jgi:ribosomal protein L29
MQFQNAVSPIDQPHKLRETRREIARLMMELNLRRKASQEAAAQKENKES